MMRDPLEAISDPINKLIDEAIDQLADDNPTLGAEALQELAKIFAKAGQPIQSFLNIRTYIINEAIAKTDPLFISLKLESAEAKLREARNGTRIITH